MIGCPTKGAAHQALPFSATTEAVSGCQPLPWWSSSTPNRASWASMTTVTATALRAPNRQLEGLPLLLSPCDRPDPRGPHTPALLPSESSQDVLDWLLG